MDTVHFYADSLGFVRDTMYLYIDSINLLQDTALAHNIRLIAIENDTTHFKEAYNDKINSASFGTGTGVLTLTQQDAGTVTTSLDGRYSLSSAHNILANDTWFYSYNYAGALIGAWKISKDNTWVFATPVEISSFRLLPDSRYTIANIPIQSAPYGDTVSVGLGIDDRRILQLSLVSDGAGTGITPTAQITGVLRVLDSIVGTYGRFTAQVQADSVNAVSKYLLNGVDIRVTGTLDTLAYKDQDNEFTVDQTITGRLLATDVHATDSISAANFFASGLVKTAQFQLTTTPSNGYVLKCDVDGNGSWQAITNAYQGSWNAHTNTPTIIDGTGTAGDFYLVSEGDTIDLGSGNVIFLTGGTAIYSGTVWEAINPSQIVTSVNSLIGDIQLNPIISGDTLWITGATDSINLETIPAITNIQDSITKHKGWYYTLRDSVIANQDSITKHSGWYYTLRDSVVNSMDSIVNHTVRYYGILDSLNSHLTLIDNHTDSITKHTGWYYSLQDSVATNILNISKLNDSITKHKGWYYSLQDSVVTNILNIGKLQDSVTKHSGWHYSLRDSVVNNMDSITKHSGWYYSLRDSVINEMDSTTKHTGWYYSLRDSVINNIASSGSLQDSITNIQVGTIPFEIA
jgi:hypothetical protein